MMNKKTSIAGIVLVILGFLLLMSKFEIHLFQFVLPLALIAIGLWFIYKRNRRGDIFPPPPGVYTTTTQGPSPEGTYTYTTSGGPTPGAPSSLGTQATAQESVKPTAFPQLEGGKVKYSKFLGDMYIECQNINLQNVEISMFVGDLQVNLRGGRLVPGLNRMVISGFLGDILILVPRDVPVFVHCSGFVGDVDLFGRRTSGFGNTLDAQSPNYDTAEAKLYIATNNFVGDVRVYIV